MRSLKSLLLFTNSPFAKYVLLGYFTLKVKMSQVWMFFAFIHMTFPPKLLIALIWSGECMMSSIKWGINYLWEKKAKEGNDRKAPICAECQGCTKSMPSLKAQHNSIGSKIRLLFSIFFSSTLNKKGKNIWQSAPTSKFLVYIRCASLIRRYVTLSVSTFSVCGPSRRDKVSKVRCCSYISSCTSLIRFYWYSW